MADNFIGRLQLSVLIYCALWNSSCIFQAFLLFLLFFAVIIIYVHRYCRNLFSWDLIPNFGMWSIFIWSLFCTRFIYTNENSRLLINVFKSIYCWFLFTLFSRRSYFSFSLWGFQKVDLAALIWKQKSSVLTNYIIK